MIVSSRVWFITGASTGFGRLMTVLALERGETVVATLRKPAVLNDLQHQYPAPRLLVLPMDVTKTEEIDAAFMTAVKTYGRVDVVFNNAGYTVLGEVESVVDSFARDMFDVNFWGAAHVAQHAVRIFREVNKPQGGRLINSSSLLGIIGAPALGWYSASRHALEGLVKSLASELDPEWGIMVTLVELGPYRTCAEANLVRTAQCPAYSKPTLPPSIIRATLGTTKGPDGPQDPAKAAQKLFDLSNLATPPLHLPLGRDATVHVGQWLEKTAAEMKSYHGWSEGLDCERVD